MACRITYKGKQYSSTSALQLDVLKDRNLLNRYNQLINRPSLDLGELEKFENAKRQIQQLLPNIGVKELDGMLDNVVNKGITVGYFVDQVIYLAENSPIGTAYHEAFHAVFRTYLNDNQISHYLQQAKEQYGQVSDAELENFRNMSSTYESLTKQELENLYYEEQMAEQFREYMLNKKPKTVFSRLFAKLKNFIKSIFITSGDIKSLFAKIETGGFREATPVYNNYRQSAAFKIKSQINDRQFPILAEDEKQIVTNIAILASQDGITELTINEIVDYMDEVAIRFNPNNWEKELFTVPVSKALTVKQRLAAMYNSLSNQGRYYLEDNEYKFEAADTAEKQAVSNELRQENAKAMLRSVNRYLSLFSQDIIEDKEEDDTPDEDNVDSIRAESRVLKGSIRKLGEFLKKFTDTIQTYTDYFDLGLDFDNPTILKEYADPKHIFTIPNSGIVFATLRRALANVDKENILHYILTNELPGKSMQAFTYSVKEQIKADANLSEDQLIERSTDKLFLEELSQKSKLFTALVGAFNTQKDTFISVKYDNNTPVIIHSNIENKEQQTLLEWSTAAASLNMQGSAVLEVIEAISDALEPSKVLSAFKEETDILGNLITVAELVDDVKLYFDSIGFNISKELIKFNMVDIAISKYRDQYFEDNGIKLTAKEAISEMSTFMPDSYIQMYKTKYTTLRPQYKKDKRVQIKNLSDKTNNILYNIQQAIASTGSEQEFNIIPQLINNIGVKDAITAPIDNLAYTNSLVSSTFTNDSILSGKKSIFTINNPTFLTELYNTLNSVEMLSFIDLVNDNKLEEARDLFTSMFGIDSKYGYNEYLTNKLYNTFINSPYVKKFTEEEVDSASLNLINSSFTNLFLQQINHVILFDYGNFDATPSEFSDASMQDKLKIKLGLYAQDSEKDVRNVFFLPQIDEAKNLNRAVNFPVIESETREIGKAIVQRSLQSEYNKIANEVKYFIENIKNNKLDKDFMLYDGYNSVFEKVNGERNLYIPTFNKEGGFAKFKKVERQYNEYGEYIGSNLVDAERGLKLELPRAFKLFEFKNIDGAARIEQNAQRLQPYEFVDLSNFLNKQFNNFIDLLDAEGLLARYDYEIVKC